MVDRAGTGTGTGGWADYGEVVQTEVELPFPVDLRSVRRGIEGATLGDREGRELWWATVTPDGPASLHLRALACSRGQRARARTVLSVAAYGEGAGWAVRQAPALLGAHDRPEDFRPAAGLVSDLHARFALRLGRTDRVFDAVLAAVIGQKVVVATASEAVGSLVARHGELAPGPTPRPLRMRPRAERLAELSSVELHRVGLERRRADILVRTARRAGRLEEAGVGGAASLDAALLTLDGVGPWTSALVRAAALGDGDAVAVGDYHLHNHVCWALAGEPRGDDARMLELLEPFRGHRGRVVSLLRRAGLTAPRRGPRLRLLPLRAFDRPDASLRRLARD